MSNLTRTVPVSADVSLIYNPESDWLGLKRYNSPWVHEEAGLFLIEVDLLDRLIVALGEVNETRLKARGLYP